ncbi:hypothetical protein ACTPOK_20055 [Streptomyces inhibens]|uniref:hypothetical protein n=1 Tax=Streptomyces inhibens TaxID=2293571 RepID=UPI00402ABA23
MTLESSGPTRAVNASNPAVVDAPRITAELGWVAQRAGGRRPGSELGREYLLRRAALLDRTALQEAAICTRNVAEPSAQTADAAAIRLIEYDSAHNGLSIRGAELVTDADRRDYVREQYRAWSITQLR